MAKYCPYCVSKIEFGNSCPNCNLRYSYRPRPEHLQPGTMLHQKYLIGRVIGQGGFGITYLGRDLLLDMKVAVKEFFPRNMAERNSSSGNTHVSLFDWSYSSAYGDGKKQFIQEARTIAKMDKESAVVTVRDFFEENNSAYIVMEYVDGEDLRSLMKKQGKPMESAELLPLLEPVFDALDELHGIGLIHRDISPDNIMIEEGRARLIDFGCARASTGDAEDEASALKHGFSPIEQYENRNMGPWTDVYAMAASIYYCLTGRLVPRATERLEHDSLAHPIALGVKMTPRQDRALMKALSVQAQQRYQSMKAFGKDLFVHRNKGRLIAVVSCVLAAAVVVAALHFKPAVEVETRAKESSFEMLSEEELTQQEQEKQKQLAQMLSRTELNGSEKTNYYNIRLKNTTDFDFDSLQLQVRTFDGNGIELNNQRSSTIELKRGEEETVSVYLGNANFDRAEIRGRLVQEERGFETAYCPLPLALDVTTDTAVVIKLSDDLPASYTAKSWNATFRYTITDFRYSVSDYASGYYVKIQLSGTYDSGPENQSGSMSCHLKDKDGNTVTADKQSSWSISFPKLRPGDSFAGANSTIWSLPAGEYTLVLENG